MENKSTSSQLPTALRLGNTHFSTAGHAFRLATPTSANSSTTPAATRPSLPSFSFTQIQIADVLKELQNLDPYKSAGLDNLDPLFLKLSAAIVATPINSLFNLSFILSEIPKDWKAAASSVCQIRGHVVRSSGSLYGGATGFNSRAGSFLCIYQ
ncbi:unnamed protein product [Oncorhynchus mykiss]|uniref:Reverse transcriptase domain-containing protein n=1 Tax=Oncorhynchus mykiss TaxID=8022 RepID=A0A060XXJ8_ONCMY|nr:unnamed protein product [Oncorhynchus mykiss]